MEFVNFGTFETRSPLLTSDYLVGYKTTGPTEIKTQVKDILDLITDKDQQTLSFNENNKDLSISLGNTVSLSAFTNDILPTTTNYLSTNLVAMSSVSATGTFVIDTNSTDAALRVTQTGSGQALVVEDSTNPDATPFVVDQTGTLVIGASAALSTVGINLRSALFVTSTTSGKNTLEVRNHVDASTGSNLIFRKTRTNNVHDYSLTTTPLCAGDLVGAINFTGNNTILSQWNVVNLYDTQPGQLPQGSRVLFNTLSSGNVINTLVLAEGKVGIGTLTPNEALTVVGNISATGTFVIDTNTTDAALRVTQTGSGRALVVEDSTNPDATPFVIDRNGSLIVGASAHPFGTSTSVPMAVFTNNTISARRSVVIRNDANSNLGVPILQLVKTRLGDTNNTSYTTGTAPLCANDVIFSIQGNSRPSSGTTSTGFEIIGVNKYDSVTGSISGGIMAFSVADANAGFTVPALVINEKNIGIGIETPNEALTVVGNVSATGIVHAQGGTVTGNLVVSQNLTAGKIELAQSSLDVGSSLTSSLSTLYMSINGVQYAVPVLKVPLVPASAEDNAADAAYDDGLGNGDNGGSGFGAWEISINSGTGYAGTYVNSSTDQGFGDINTSGEAFGLYAGNISDNASVDCLRPLSTPLTVGNALSAAIAAAYRSGEKGFTLWDQADEELYTFTVAGDEYKINGSNLGWSYSQTSIFNLVAKQIDVNTVNITLTRDSNVDSRNVTGVVAKISFFNNGTNGGDLENLRFNSLKAYPYQ